MQRQFHRKRELSTALLICWGLLLLPAGFAMLVCFTVLRMGEETVSAGPPPLYQHAASTSSPPNYDLALLDIARVLAWTSLAAGGVVIASIIDAVIRLRASVFGIAGLMLAILLSQAPAAIRAFLPWEDPWSGEGSPMAALIGLVFLAGFFYCVLAVPAIIIAIFALRSRAVPAHLATPALK